MSPFLTVMGCPIIYPGTSTPKVGALIRPPVYVNVTLAVACVASIEIVHFLFWPRFGFFTKALELPSYETYSSGHYPKFTSSALQSSSISNCQPSVGAPFTHFIQGLT